MKTKTKGLEPIVAAVLLIVVAAIGAVLVYSWFAGYVTKTTSQAEQMATSEKLKIEAAAITTGGTNTATLYIRNLGGDNVTLATAYILKPGTINPICTVQSFTVYKPDLSTPGAKTLYPGALQKVEFSVSGCDLQSGYDYVIKLATLKGTEFAVTVTAS
jgi:archaellum component FlaG (FlaF/FlaG flagellin family)